MQERPKRKQTMKIKVIILSVTIMVLLTGCTQKEIQELQADITKQNKQIEQIKQEENKNKEAMAEYRNKAIRVLQGEETEKDRELQVAVDEIQKRIKAAVDMDVRVTLQREQEDEDKWQDNIELEAEREKRIREEYTRVHREVKYNEYKSTTNGESQQEFMYTVRGLRQEEHIVLEVKWKEGVRQSLGVYKVGG